MSLPTCLFGVFFPFVVWTPLARFQPGLGDDGGNLNLMQKLYVFYKCPKVKYAGMMISFFLFIFLYSYVILFGYRWAQFPFYSAPELCLYVWIAVILVGEIRELFKEPSKRLSSKILTTPHVPTPAASVMATSLTSEVCQSRAFTFRGIPAAIAASEFPTMSSFCRT